MSIVSKKTLEGWWELIDLGPQHIEFLKQHVLKWKDKYILDNGSLRPSFVRLPKENLDPVDSAIISPILSKENNYRFTHSRDRTIGTFYWRYLIDLPDSKEFLIDISSALGIIWIWEELQKKE